MGESCNFVVVCVGGWGGIGICYDPQAESKFGSFMTLIFIFLFAISKQVCAGLHIEFNGFSCK